MLRFDSSISAGAALRCPRCGRLNPADEHRCLRCQARLAQPPQQQRLDLKPAWPKVIPFEWIAPERAPESTRQPGAPPKHTKPVTAKAQHKPAGLSRRSARSKSYPGQLSLDLQPPQRLPVAAYPGSHPETPPAPRSLRIAATAADAALILACVGPFLLGVRIGGGQVPLHPSAMPYYGLILLVLAVFYKAFFSILNRDSPGLRLTGLRLIRFDRRPPGWRDRVRRLCAAGVTTAGLGVGLWWALLARESLTWYDLISQTCVVEADSGPPPGRRADP